MINPDKNYPSFEPAEELLACFNDQGALLEPKFRETIHTKPYRTWHGVASVWLLNSQGQILCSRRSRLVSGNPGRWQTYFGGHVKSGKDFLETARDELKEEVGLLISIDDLKLIESGQRTDVMHFYRLYTALFDDSLSKLQFTDGEVVEAKWLSFDSYQEMKKSDQDQWCNGINDDQYQKALQGLNITIQKK